MKVVINPQYEELKDFIYQLPTTFGDRGNTIHAHRNIIKIFEVDNQKINVKSFKQPIFINRLAYVTIRKSKANRSFSYGNELIKRGFKTPSPIAYIEQTSNGLLSNSYYISVQEEFDGIMQELQRGTIEGREELLRQFGLYTADLHNKQVMHLDYSSGNILYKLRDNTYTFYLVDLNRMTFDKPIDIDAGCFSFRRLWGRDEMIKIIVDAYAEGRGFNKDECSNKVFEYRKEFWEKFTKRHPDSTPYINE